MSRPKFTSAWLAKHSGKKPVKRAKVGKPSHLEELFLRLWKEIGGPELRREFRFHPVRKWRADFAHEPSLTLIEIEGGAWCGRHTRGAGFMADAEKYFSAYLYGWTVVRLTKPQITKPNLIALALRAGIKSL